MVAVGFATLHETLSYRIATFVGETPIMIATLCALTVLAAPQEPAPWTIGLDLLSEKKVAYDLEVVISAQGETANVSMIMAVVFQKAQADGKGKATVEWQDLAVDNQNMGTQGPWEVALGANGLIESSTDGDEYRRMLQPIWPVLGSDLKVGSDWSVSLAAKANAGQTVDWKLKTIGVEKIGDVETLKVAAKMTEKDGTSTDGTWWLRKDGKVQKFEVDVKQWTVPMAGESFDAKVTGKLKG